MTDEKQAKRIEWLRTFGADEHFMTKTWETFRIDSKNRRAVEIVQAMQLGKLPGAFLYGRPGSGKTHLMKCVFNHIVDWKIELQDKGHHSSVKPYWINLSFYLEELRPPKENTIIKKRAQEATILFVDDLGAANRSDWVTDQIFQLLDYRSERELQTFATSNYKLADLEPIYGQRIISRLMSLTIALEMIGQDHRREQMNLNFENVISIVKKKGGTTTS